MATQMAMMTDMISKVLAQLVTAAPNNTPTPTYPPSKLPPHPATEPQRETNLESQVEMNYEGMDDTVLTELGTEFYEDIQLTDTTPPPSERPSTLKRVRILTERGREHIRSQQRRLQKALLADDRKRGKPKAAATNTTNE